MIARMALPRLGGAPAVWNSAMLVYQALLLGGYAYAQRSEEHTSELQSLMRTSYAVFCLKKQTHILHRNITYIYSTLSSSSHYPLAYLHHSYASCTSLSS